MNEDVQLLQERFAGSILEQLDILGKPALVIKREALTQICNVVKNELSYDYLACITGVDYPNREPPHFEVIYNLWSYSKNRHLILKTRCPREDAKVPSVVRFWKSALFLERETYDLLGIKFEGHPNLKRIFLPDPWVGHPLRKDYDMSKEQYISKGELGEDVVSFDPTRGW